jgi:hypothetical protein
MCEHFLQIYVMYVILCLCYVSICGSHDDRHDRGEHGGEAINTAQSSAVIVHLQQLHIDFGATQVRARALLAGNDYYITSTQRKR